MSEYDEASWVRNCRDCVITFEVDEAVQASIDKLGLRKQCDFQNEMFWPVLQAMVRGVHVDTARRQEFALELAEEIDKRNKWISLLLGHPLNPRSPLQMKRLFYEDFKQPPIFSRKAGSAGNLTLDDEALQKIARREPLLRPLVRNISELRSLGVFLSTFVGAELGSDGRLRCSYNIAGTETFRLSSSKDAFGSGLNLQNIPAGGKEADEPEALVLPNVKTLFVPDEGYTFFDGDLERADLYVVVWEAEDDDLKKALASGVDVHMHSARAIYDLPIADHELLESHPNFPELKAKYHAQRQNVRQVVHATNYVGSARTVAANFGLHIREVEKFQAKWFSLHPGIKRWHERVIAQLTSKHYVENRFGYRRYFFSRISGAIPEAVAWIPQSTVAHYINQIWLSAYYNLPELWVLLQVHDSLAGQFPTSQPELITKLTLLSRQIKVPYDDPLVIPFAVKTSPVSWGDCK